MSVLVYEAICAGKYSAWTALHDFGLHIRVQWLVRILVLTSMMLQLVLVVLGARRYLTSSGTLRFLVWGAYISADAVATSALGIMMHSDRKEIYGIWAPVLLIHLGGPDAITAYSMADNELWMRHGFNMVYQVCVAVYVIYASSMKLRSLAAAILLLLVGFLKYGERTLALRYGSYPRIVMSSLPISKCMEIKCVAQERIYVVMGEDKVERMIEQKQASSSRKGRTKEELQMSSLKEKDIVTIEDVEQAGKVEKDDKRRFVTDRGYELCLSHALFKMYKRRFGSLYFFVEGDWKETRAFWVNRSGGEAFRIVEMELKFMYDALFSKYSNPWFTKWGMVLRFLNITLMGAAGYLILGEKETRQAQRMVTYVLISVAFVVEVFQIWRVIVSDWTRVHLICAYVVAYRRQESWSGFCRFQVIKITMVVISKFQEFSSGGNRYLSEVVGGDRYWSNQIPQHCLIETWLNSSPIMCKLAGLFPKPERSIVSWYTKIWHANNVPVEDDLKDFIFKILKKACSEENSTEQCKQKFYNFEKDLFQGETEIQEVLKSHVNLEEVILIWHIATTLCDSKRIETKKELPQKNETEEKLAPQRELTEKNVKWSITLSRYCAYLLMSRPHLLPLHPKMARIVYMQLVNQLLDKLTLGSIIHKNPEYLLGSKKNDDLLGSGAKLAHQLLKKQEGDRWKLLAEYWGKLVIYMALYNKAIYHADCVAAGGEFLSQVWVLLAHMGCGEQSDSAVPKKVEMASNKELSVGERRTEQDPAEMKRTLTALGKELETAKKGLSDREKELDTVKKDFNDRENAFTAMEKELALKKKDLSDREKELSATKGGLSNPEQELAVVKKISSDLEEELAATKKILRDREEDFAAMKKNLLLRKANFE
ncbi:hypothetical protein SUGI_0390750 [Cryptomeria japonica]|uniref:uncharacterized protein LOC131875124 n=1 Tax=Cryptomeria japonica TaxID=3369 RepID=UPI002408C86F|nr:uncharacterized protein LOC131875124 [Cryptomeria japonica]GLJ21277.1 hypothetical protein SUGI_0390750 [Cryptomeria japonica]